jgi:4-hydroxymandelate oxidase
MRRARSGTRRGGVTARKGTRRRADGSGAPAEASAKALSPPVSVPEFESAARSRFSRVAWEYINSGSADEITLRWNRESFDRVRLRGRVLVNVATIDTRTTLLGHELPHPILLAPTSSHMLAHPEGEVETARGAGAAGAVMVVSTLSNRSIEDVAAASRSPVWFQLYAEDGGRTRELAERAKAAGCRALCVTVDLARVYARDRESKIAHEVNLPFPNLGISAGAGGAVRGKGRGSASFDWASLERLLAFAPLPVLLKGILDPDDAERAVQMGAAGLVVSNHGGRGLDTLPATIDALPAVVDRVAGRVPLLLDGGVRRGTDVLKALASGASAVLIGRPYLYGLGVEGASGVRRVVEILRTELEQAMALTGRVSIEAIDRTVLFEAPRASG